MNPKKQHLLDTVSSNIPTDLVTGWRPSFGNSVRGEIRVKVADNTHKLRYLIRERDELTVQIDRLNKEIEQLQEQFMAMETQ